MHDIVARLLSFMHADNVLIRKLFAFIEIADEYNFTYVSGESESQVYPGKPVYIYLSLHIHAYSCKVYHNSSI